jgi:RNase H-fold protein (predicted Holliday junction resolvase)
MTDPEPSRLLLAVDPGSAKCGLALLSEAGRVLEMVVVARSELVATVLRLVQGKRLVALLVGDRTTHRAVIGELQALAIEAPLHVVPEHNTTLRARERYLQDHPPRGWRRLIPRGMILPAGPLDHYAALVMAEDWLASQPQPD